MGRMWWSACSPCGKRLANFGGAQAQVVVFHGFNVCLKRRGARVLAASTSPTLDYESTRFHRGVTFLHLGP